MAQIRLKHNNVRTTPFYIIKNGVVQSGITVIQNSFEALTGSSISTSSAYRRFYLLYTLKSNSSIDYGSYAGHGENYQFNLPKNNFKKICLSSDAKFATVSKSAQNTNLWVYASNNNSLFPQYNPAGSRTERADVKELFLTLGSNETSTASAEVIGEHKADFNYKQKQSFNIVVRTRVYRLNGESSSQKILNWQIKNLWLE